MANVRVERSETPVMYVSAEGDPRYVAGAGQRAFADLESRLGSLRGRRFFGVFDPITREYLACVQRTDGDDPAALGLRETVLPGGTYLRARLTGEPPAVYDRIAPTFDALEAEAEPDPGRPLIEFYRRYDQIEVLLPVA
jgi:hypothetical protein